VVKVLACVGSRRRVERIMLAPAPAEYGPKAGAEAGVLPALEGTAVDVRAQNKRTVAGQANAKTIVVANWSAEAELRLGV
jgi:hypothetical protein